MSVDTLIRHYFNAFNERRFAQGAALFAPESRFAWIPFGDPRRGEEGYRDFIERWVAAFPNAQLRIERVEQRGDRRCEIEVLATGTHAGTLDMGVYCFKPTQITIALRARQVFEFEGEQIVYTSLSMDSQELTRRLTTLDAGALETHLARIVQLRSAIAEAVSDERRLREVAEQLGRELDAARRILRPYYSR